MDEIDLEQQRQQQAKKLHKDRSIDHIYNPERLLSSADIVTATMTELKQNLKRLQDPMNIYKAVPEKKLDQHHKDELVHVQGENNWYHNVILSTSITDSLIATGFIFNFELDTQVKLARINEIAKEINAMLSRGTAAVTLGSTLPSENTMTMFCFNIRRLEQALVELLEQTLLELKPIP